MVTQLQPTPPRATHWRLRTRTLELGRRPLWMGIVNVTPDSFSDGGQFRHVDDAVAQALHLVDQGADILDIGGESTRPGAVPVPLQEELDRVLTVVAEVARRTDVPLSIDTTKAAVAQAALGAGAEIINDVSGLEADPDMPRVARTTGAGLCAMHCQGTPQTMQHNPTYQDVVAEIFAYLRQRRDALQAQGIHPQRICLDPGIGFGKTAAHNFQLMSHCYQFHQLGCPLLVGPSRKGFLGTLLDHQQADRSFATVGAALALAAQGVQIVRVHEVQPVREACAAFAASGGVAGA